MAGCRSSATPIPESVSFPPVTSSASGGFYGGDLPPTRVPANLAMTPDAIPMNLPLSKTGNRPYKVLGKSYTPMKSARNYRARGVASWYGKKFHGRRTSSGEPYDMFAMTAAHTVLPLPSFVRVTSLSNGKSVVVKVNDRGPFLHNRLIDLSYAAALKLGITKSGTGKVEIVAIDASEMDSFNTQSQRISGTAGGEVDMVARAVSAGSAAQFSLQLGSFSELDNALRLRQKLRQGGYLVFPESDQQLTAAGAPYRVVSGPYSSFVDAQRAQSALQVITGQSGKVKTILANRHCGYIQGVF